MGTMMIAIADDVAEGLEQMRHDQESAPDLATVVNEAIRDYLIQRGYLPARPPSALYITPFEGEDVPSDLSIEHDRYLAEWPE